MASRSVPPPDFRYVWLTPAPAQGSYAFGGALVAASTLLYFGHGHAAVTLGGLAAGTTLLVRRLVQGLRRASGTSMAIVPWGVLVDPEGSLRVLRWPAIERVLSDVTHVQQGGEWVAVRTLVTVRTARESFRAQASGAVGLESLVANLEGYSNEAARPPSLDLDGLTDVAGHGAEPAVDALLHAAEELCSTGRGAVELGLPAGGYRTMGRAVAGPETLALLRRVLGAHSLTLADARPLAALIAGLLGAAELIPELCLLVSSPHALTAATAKAAAIRLGAPMSRAGSIDEVAPFLFSEDAEALARFAGERQD